MTTLHVITHDGQEFDVSVDSYDAAALNTKLNDNNILTVDIGGLIFSRIDIKRIVPLT